MKVMEELQIEIQKVDSQEGVTKKARYLGICFMILFGSFGSSQQLISSLYKEEGYEYLGLFGLLSLYIVFSVMSLFAKYIVSRYSYRNVFVASSLGYLSFIICGVWVCSCKGQSIDLCSPFSIYFIVILCSSLCGTGSATLWVAQGGYMDALCQQVPSSRGNLCGIFWSLRMSSHILGNISAMIILNLISDHIVFFGIMSIILMSSTMMLWFVAPVDQKFVNPSKTDTLLNQDEHSQRYTLKNQIKEVFKIMGSRKFRPFLFFIIMGGIPLAFSSGFFRNIVQGSLNIEGNEREIGINLSFILIGFGCFEYIGGKVSGKLADMCNPYHLATVGTLIQLFGLLLSLVSLQAQSYNLCFVMGIVFGFCDCYVNNIIQVISNQDYKGQLEVFQSIRFIFSITTALTQLCIILLNSFPPYIFISVIFTVTLLCNFIVSLFFHFQKEGENKNDQIVTDQEVNKNLKQ